MDGTLTVENGTVYDLLDLIGLNTGTGTLNALDRWVTRARMLWQRRRTNNVPGRSRRNVAHHYDISGDIYDLFLDADRQYTCAYHPTPDVTLEEAQQAKKTHIAAKLLLEPGQRILDMGCGWGGLSLYLAEVRRRGRHRRDAVGGTARLGQPARPRPRPPGPGAVRAVRLPRRRGAGSTGSPPSASSSTWARRTTTISSRTSAACSPTTALR